MRRFAIATAVAAVQAASFASPSHAGALLRQPHNDYYFKSYDTAFEPVCVTKKIRSTDENGNPVVKVVRICR